MARKPRSKEDWIEKFTKTHGEYDYSRVTSIAKSDQKLSIICHQHGVFLQSAAAHGRGQGCPQCSLEARQLKQSITKEEFIKRASELYSGLYDYSSSVFINAKTKISIKCPSHGEFQSTPAYHLRGIGCPDCEKLNNAVFNSFKDFKKAAIKKWGTDYGYDQSTFTTKNNPIRVNCLTHGLFDTTPAKHLKGAGCPKCKITARGKIRPRSTEDFVFKANMLHQNKYDYSEVVYKSSKVPIKIKCPVHGNFTQTPNDHITTKGCEKCGIENRASQLRLGTDSFIQKAKAAHQNSYTYDKVKYGKTNSEKVLITCKKHGDFQQTPMHHLSGGGCPKCSFARISSQEKELGLFLKSIYSGPVIFNDRVVLAGKELDIFLPEINVAIEFNGLYWHSFSKVGKNHHLEKTLKCIEQGVRLLHIWSDDWENRQDIVKNHIKSVLGASSGPRVFARKTTVKPLAVNEAKKFLNANHIQGYSSSTVKLGLYSNDGELVACALFRKDSSRKDCYVLTRYATNKTVIGGHSKLLKHFIKNHEFKEITTFADLSFSYGDLYRKTGWVENGFLYPDYTYILKDGRKHKFGYRLKRFATDPDLIFIEGLTESQLAAKNGIEKIYDAGKIRFTLSKEAFLKT
jgi:hypothetical protein